MKKKCLKCGKEYLVNPKYGKKQLEASKFCSLVCSRTCKERYKKKQCKTCFVRFKPKCAFVKYCDDCVSGNFKVKKCRVCLEMKKKEDFVFIRTTNRYESWCNRCRVKREAKTYHEVIKKSPKLFLSKAQGWRNRNKEKANTWAKEYRRVLKEKVFQAYCPNGKVGCGCCGESRRPFLSLDHEKGDGAKHRKMLTSTKGDVHGRSYKDIYLWLRRNNYPQNLGLRVLCMNCNWATRNGRVCPHNANS